jgi:5-methylcytosine-specific restriction endonuclease McrA
MIEFGHDFCILAGMQKQSFHDQVLHEQAPEPTSKNKGPSHFDCSKLDNTDLISKIRALAHEERRTTTLVLHHLAEIEKRMLHLERGYSSLYDFCVKELGYSEGGAYRRISAMRLLKSLPEKSRQDTEAKIESGQLTLSTVSSLQGFLRAEKKHGSRLYSSAQKIDLLNTLEVKSRREVDSVLAGLQPALLPSDRERQISEEKIEIRFTADKSLMEKLQRLKNRLAHQDPEISYNQLFHQLADCALESWDRIQPPELGIKSNPQKEGGTSTVQNQTPPAGFQEAPQSTPVIDSLKKDEPYIQKSFQKNWRYIPARTRREVWQRDQGRCVYQSTETGRRCESGFGLEFDHILPVALGGLSLPSNLRLLCRNHNVHAAVQKLGMEVMRPYLSKNYESQTPSHSTSVNED